MYCAVVGLGLAGLGAAHALVKRGAEVVLFDLFPPGEKPGGIESGLLHPYPGKKGLRSRYAHDALSKSIALIDEAEKALGRKVALRNGILRKGWTPDEWTHDLESYQDDVLITSGLTVFLRPYLKGLFQALPNCKFVQGKIENEDDFDQVLYAIGSGFIPWNISDVQYVKGQVLMAKEHQKLARSIIGSGYISPTERPGIVQIGATYEHNPKNDQPNLEEAKKHLNPRIKTFLVPLDSWEIVECLSCIRVCHQSSYLPIVKRISPRRVIFTGLGSRGLLYHALYGEHAAEEIYSHRE